MEDLISTRVGWPSVARACRAALHWAALTDAQTPLVYGLDDPSEPLLLLFERGGGFTTEHGFIDLVGVSVHRRTWQDHLVAEPIVTLTQSAIDARPGTVIPDVACHRWCSRDGGPGPAFRKFELI